MQRQRISTCFIVDEIAPASADVLNQLENDGWVIVENALSAALTESLRQALDAAGTHQRPIQVQNGVGEGTEGTAHHLPGYRGPFLEMLDVLPCVDVLERFLSSKVIVNTFGGATLRRGFRPYVANVHRDVRTFSRETRLMVQILVMLDDFTLENGATYLLTGSHRVPERPTDAEFFQRADRAVGRKGSMLIFDSQIWHAAGDNSTDFPRRCLTLTFTRPSLKPQMDYCRMIGWDQVSGMSDRLQQFLGYYSRIPSSLDEWYRPPETRFYRRGQG